MKVVEMVGGCTWTFGGLLGKWNLKAEKCVAEGVCRCVGQASQHLLKGDYPGFGKRA